MTDDFANPLGMRQLIVLHPHLQQAAMTQTVVILCGDIIQLFWCDQNGLAVAQQNRPRLALEVAVTTGAGLGLVFFHLLRHHHIGHVFIQLLRTDFNGFLQRVGQFIYRLWQQVIDFIDE